MTWESIASGRSAWRPRQPGYITKAVHSAQITVGNVTSRVGLQGRLLELCPGTRPTNTSSCQWRVIYSACPHPPTSASGGSHALGCRSYRQPCRRAAPARPGSGQTGAVLQFQSSSSSPVLRERATQTDRCRRDTKPTTNTETDQDTGVWGSRQTPG